MGHQHGDSCKHEGGGGGGGHGHSHGHGAPTIGGIDMPSIILMALVTNVVFWFISAATTFPSIVGLYILICLIIFGALHKVQGQKMAGKTFAFFTNFAGVNAIVFLISLLFVGIEFSSGFRETLVHVDLTAFQPTSSYLNEFFVDVHKRGATGILLQIDPKHDSVSNIAESIRSAGLDVVPMLTGRHQSGDVSEWMEKVSPYRIHLGSPALEELNEHLTTFSSKNVTFLVWDSTTKNGNENTKWPVENEKVQFVIHPDHGTESEATDPSNWKHWQSYRPNSLWTSAYYSQSEIFSIGLQAQDVYRWVEIEKSGKRDFNGIILLSKELPVNKLASLVPVHFPALALDLFVINTQTDYRFVKKKVFNSLGLGNLNLLDVSKTIAGAADKQGDFVGADLFRAAARWERGHEPDQLAELKSTLAKYYNVLPSVSFLDLADRVDK